MRFLEKIANHYPVFLTHGQHDYDSRTLMSPDNTLMSLCNDISESTKKGIKYIHKASIQLGNRTIYFSGWQPIPNYADTTADILVTHVSVSGAVNARDSVVPGGQSFDNKRFKLVIAGDIHNPQTIDNIIIPGPPICHNFNDPYETSVILLDLDTLQYERVRTSTDKYPFLQFLTSEENPDPENPYIIWKPPGGKAHEVEQLRKSIDIYETLSRYVVENRLQEIHKQIIDRLPSSELDPVDLRFRLKKLVIRNFRSIHNFAFEIPEGLIRITGANGAGKSSLLDALRYVLFGEGRGRNFVRNGAKQMSVTVELEYKQTQYEITRSWTGSGQLSYSINGKPQQAENQTALQARISEDLRFRRLAHIFWRSQNDGRLLYTMNYGSRVDLVSEVLGINVLNKFAEVAEVMAGETSAHKNEVEQNVATLEGQLSSLRAFDTTIVEEQVEDKLTETEWNLSRINEVIQARTVVNGITAKLNEVEQVVSGFKPIDEALIRTKPFIVNEIISFSSSIANLNTVISSKTQQINNNVQEIDKLDRVLRYEVLSKLQDSLSKLAKIKVGTCYVCGAPLGIDRQREAQEAVSGEFKTLSNKKTNILESIKGYEETNTKARSELEQLKIALDKEQYELDKSNASLKTVEAEEASRQMQQSTRSRLEELYTQSNIAIDNLGALSEKYSIDISVVEKMQEEYSSIKSDLLIRLDRKREALRIVERITTTEKSLADLRTKVSTISAQITKYQHYHRMVGPSGPVLRSLLMSASDLMSDEKIRVKTHKSLQNGEERPDFSMEMQVHKDWISYNDLSGGQQILCDIHIMRSLINISGGTGLLVLDETINSIYPNLLDELIADIKNIESHTVFLVSHHEDVPGIDREVNARLIEGTSYYEI